MTELAATGGLDAATINGRPLQPAVRAVAGIGSRIQADLVTAPIPQSGASYGGYPQATSAVAMPAADPSATLARYLQGY